jgi:CheY-like chemotaxis protein
MSATVSISTTAREALAMLADVDLVITDFSMPGEHGAWLLEQINASARPIPVILVSGFTANQRQALADAPFALKMLKPVDPWALAAEIRAVLGR